MLRIVRNKFFLPASWARLFVVTLVFVVFASGLFWLDFFRSYQAEMSVLIVSKTGAPGTSQDVASNMAALTKTLSFYERVLTDNDRIDDKALGLAPQQRKNLWNERVFVTREQDSSVLMVRATSDTSEQATLLARQTVATLLSVTGFYYNVKTDIDMRIVDGPFTACVLDAPFVWIMASLLTGIVVTTLFFWLLNLIPGFIGGYKESVRTTSVQAVAEDEHSEFVMGDSVPWIDPQKFVPAKPKTLSFENVPHETKGVSEAPMAHAMKRAQAPLNLPTADDQMNLPVADEASLPFEFEARPAATESYRGEPEEIEMSFEEPILDESEKSASPSETPAETHGEPTVEEYKRRLNELLSGGK